VKNPFRYLHAAEVIHRDLKPSNMCALFAAAYLRARSATPHAPCTQPIDPNSCAHCVIVVAYIPHLKPYAISLVGEDCDVHICDFGLARRESNRLLSQYIVTRWYRPPEVLLCKRQYNKAVDIWSAGCIFAELIMRPSPHRHGLFPGLTYKDQTDKIIQVTAAPACSLHLFRMIILIGGRCWERLPMSIWHRCATAGQCKCCLLCMNFSAPSHPFLLSNAADYVRAQFMSPPTLKNRLAEHLRQNARPGLLSDLLLDLIVCMLSFNPQNRITAAGALRHAYFADCEEAAIDDGEVAVPDDGEGKSVHEILEILKKQQALLRFEREENERQFSMVDDDMPEGM
jgi:serine/threonine protein kinase